MKNDFQQGLTSSKAGVQIIVVEPGLSLVISVSIADKSLGYKLEVDYRGAGFVFTPN